MMACEQYQDWLTDAALGGLEGRRKAELRAHLETCAACRESLESEERLFAAMERGLQFELAAEPSPDFVARVRQRIAEHSEPARGWFGGWVPAAVGALAALVLLAVWIARREPTEVKVAVTPPAAIEKPKEPVEQTPGAAVSGGEPSGSRSRATLPPALREPEVLVSRNEQAATLVFLEGLRRRQERTWLLASEAAARPPRELAAPEELKIAPLVVRPLERSSEILEKEQNGDGIDWRNRK